MKLIQINEDILTSKNYFITKLFNIQGIFVKANKDDIFIIKLISEEVSKLMDEENGDNSFNTIIEENNYSINFIHNDREIFTFYNSISADPKIYEINNGKYFQYDDISNHKFNYSLLLGEHTLEEKKTHMIIKEATKQFLYEKYISTFLLSLDNFLYNSKIFHLLYDFEYNFSYNEKIKKIMIKILNKVIKEETIYFACNNEILEIINDVQILDVEKCNGTFIMAGNDSLIYFYLPYTINDSYYIIKDQDNFQLSNIYHFFFIPKKNEFNSINILLNIEYEDDIYPVFLSYYIDFGIIPYSRNIEKYNIIFQNETNFVIPNFFNYSNGNESYFLYFRFNTTISKLNAKVFYENIIYLEDQTFIILKPGINLIKFKRNIDHYLKMVKLNKNNNSKSFYTVYKNEVVIEENSINNTENIIYIEEPSYKENIKLKIENEEEILLFVSPDIFYDFSSITHNKNIDILYGTKNTFY